MGLRRRTVRKGSASFARKVLNPLRELVVTSGSAYQCSMSLFTESHLREQVVTSGPAYQRSMSLFSESHLREQVDGSSPATFR